MKMEAKKMHQSLGALSSQTHEYIVCLSLFLYSSLQWLYSTGLKVMCFAFTHVASNVACSLVWFTCERVWHKTSKLAMRVISLVLRTRPAFLLLQPHSQAFLHFQFWSLAVYEANDGFIPGPFFFLHKCLL